MVTTVEKVAMEVGATTQQVLDACGRVGVTAWSGQTPLDVNEAARVRAALGGPPAWTPPAGPAWGPTPAPPAPAAPPPSRGGLPVPLAVLLGLLIAGIVAVGFRVADDLVGGEDAGEAQLPDDRTLLGEATLHETTVIAGDIGLGDCWNYLSGPVDAGSATAVFDTVPCEGPHDAEVYASVEHPGGRGDPYPGDAVVDQYGFDQCLIRFDGFVGRSFETSGLDAVWSYPQEEAWLLGDRSVVCSVYSLDGQPLVGSMAGSGR